MFANLKYWYKLDVIRRPLKNQNTIMDIILTLISIDIIASKFLEAYIISQRLEVFQQERNTLSRKLKEKIGVENDVWLSFFLTVLAVGMSVWLLNNFYSAAAYQLLFIFTGLLITTLNLGSAHSIYYGKQNFITEKIRK